MPVSELDASDAPLSIFPMVIASQILISSVMHHLLSLSSW